MKGEENACNEFVIAKLQALYDIYNTYIKRANIMTYIQMVIATFTIISIVFSVIFNLSFSLAVFYLALVFIVLIIMLYSIGQEQKLLLREVARKILLIEEKCLPEYARCIFSTKGILKVRSYSLCRTEEIEESGG